jgi:phosphatidylglycerophosphate synthase
VFDSRLRPLIDPPLNAAGHRLASLGVSADQVTIAGFAFGLLAAGAIAAGAFLVGLMLIAANRLCDGLDGAVARASAVTDRGGYLDIVLDFAFYAAVPLAFAAVDPARNALAAAFLLASFLVNGAAFFAFAVMAERKHLTTAAQGQKSLYYLTGLAEGGETIAFFLAFCVFPQFFPLLAALFACFCLLSAAGRIVAARRLLN